MATELLDLPIAVDVIIEGKLFVFKNGSLGEYAHPDSVPNKPFRYIAVRITAVISEAADIAFFRGVNILID